MAGVRETCHCLCIHDLPEEILERIMSYLSPYDDCKNASLVSRNWRRLMQGVIAQRKLAFCQAAKTGSLQWSHQWCDDSSLMGRCMHSTCYVDGIMYMFGGTVPSTLLGSSFGTCYCDLQQLDLGSRTWTRLMATGSYPSPKAAASLVHHDGSLILYGGWAPPVPNPPHQPSLISDDLHMYDIASNRWRSVVSSVSPPPLSHHRASIMGDLMIIFGGNRGLRKKENDIWVLSLQSMTWCCMKMKGDKPPIRDKHTQVVLDDGHLLIIGGLNTYDKEMTDVWMLDISEVPWCWRELEVKYKERAAPKISIHASCKIGECVVFFSSLRTGSSAGNPHVPLQGLVHMPSGVHPMQRQPVSVPSQSHPSPSPQGGVERGSLKDLHKHAKRPCNQGNDSLDSSHSSKTSGSAEGCSRESISVGCPCSSECQCRTPVTKAILPMTPSRGSIKKVPLKPGLSTPNSKIPHGEQQYILDISMAVSNLQANWLDIPNVNTNRRALNPNQQDDKLRYGHAPEVFFSSVCVGRAEIVRFGGMLNDKQFLRVLNNQYFAY